MKQVHRIKDINTKQEVRNHDLSFVLEKVCKEILKNNPFLKAIVVSTVHKNNNAYGLCVTKQSKLRR